LHLELDLDELRVYGRVLTALRLSMNQNCLFLWTIRKSRQGRV